jgi:hypothetical protein
VIATLNLYEVDSGSCTASQVDVYEAASSWTSTVTWNSQPSAGTLWASGSFAKGFSASCPNGWIGLSTTGSESADLATMVQGWVDDDTSNHGLIVQAASETSTSGWKKFSASESGAHAPTLTVVYSIPDYFKTKTGFWYDTLPHNHVPDPESENWVAALAQATTGHQFIRLPGAGDSESTAGGVPWYLFDLSDTDVTIYCQTGTGCPGFPASTEGASMHLDYFDPDKARPSNDLDSDISIKDVPQFGSDDGVMVSSFLPAARLRLFEPMVR